jgi:hypothetical protein
MDVSSRICFTIDGKRPLRRSATKPSTGRRDLAKHDPQVLVVVVEPTEPATAHAGAKRQVSDISVRS